MSCYIVTTLRVEGFGLTVRLPKGELMKNLLILILLSIFCISAKANERKSFFQKSKQEHIDLYKEGFLIIPATQKNFQTIVNDTIKTTPEAWKEFFKDFSEDSKEFAAFQEKHPAQAKETLQTIWNLSNSTRKKVFDKTTYLLKSEIQYSKEQFTKGADHFFLGHIKIKERSRSDREAIMNTPKRLAEEVKGDVSSFKNFLKKFRSSKSSEVDKSWSKSLSRAAEEFNNEYHKSGESSNAITALPRVFWGHLKWIYYALFKPSGRALKKSGTYILFPPVVAGIATARGLSNLGGVLYYSGKMGVHVFSPYIESAVYTSLGLLSSASTIPTVVGGYGLGAFSQVGLGVTSALASGGELAGRTTVSTSKYMGSMFYNFSKATAKTVITTSKSAVILGYNAMVALPAHIVLGAAGSVLVLVVDGTDAVIAKLRGNKKDLLKLPAGSVINLKEAKEAGIDIEVLTRDPRQIKKVIHSLPSDLKD